MIFYSFFSTNYNICINIKSHNIDWLGYRHKILQYSINVLRFYLIVHIRSLFYKLLGNNFNPLWCGLGSPPVSSSAHQSGFPAPTEPPPPPPVSAGYPNPTRVFTQKHLQKNKKLKRYPTNLRTKEKNKKKRGQSCPRSPLTHKPITRIVVQGNGHYVRASCLPIKQKSKRKKKEKTPIIHIVSRQTYTTVVRNQKD